jgi:hypothetical protein
MFNYIIIVVLILSLYFVSTNVPKIVPINILLKRPSIDEKVTIKVPSKAPSKILERSYYTDENDKINYIDYNLARKEIKFIKEFKFYIPNPFIRVDFDGIRVLNGKPFTFHINNIDNNSDPIHLIQDDQSDKSDMISGVLSIRENRLLVSNVN